MLTGAWGALTGSRGHMTPHDCGSELMIAAESCAAGEFEFGALQGSCVRQWPCQAQGWRPRLSAWGCQTCCMAWQQATARQTPRQCMSTPKAQVELQRPGTPTVETGNKQAAGMAAGWHAQHTLKATKRGLDPC
ncbi:hypothetical protein CJ030_MR1G014066 [Morella rubra]|uniref:Uncharacterized protein n=1 Tax=Morella rubra TaxID=262757 RepID=A0A6A1WMU2_9ROSI|nr:hypothetical protein CJ030_MR1G014066 [Morella rubra]